MESNSDSHITRHYGTNGCRSRLTIGNVIVFADVSVKSVRYSEPAAPLTDFIGGSRRSGFDDVATPTVQQADWRVGHGPVRQLVGRETALEVTHQSGSLRPKSIVGV